MDDLRAIVRRVLSEVSFTDNARRMSERLRAYGGAAQAADLIERFGSSGKPAGTVKQRSSRSCSPNMNT